MASLIERIAKAGQRALSKFVPAEGQNETERPKTGTWISGQRDDYSIDLPSRQATDPGRLGDNMRAADEGDIAAQMEVFEEAERDPRIARLYFKRRLNVINNPLVISPPDGDDSPQAQKAADLCVEMIQGMGGRGGIKKLSAGLFDLTDAIGKAFAVSQIAWEFEAGRFVPKQLIRWPQREFRLGSQYTQRAQDEDQLRVLTDAQPTDGEPLTDFPAGQWIVHQQKMFSTPLSRAAMFRGVVWYWLFKKFGMRDWSIFLERFGIPPRLAEYHKGADDKEQQALWTSIKNLGKDHACIYPEGSKITLLETKGLQGGAPHPEMVKHCNEEISVLISGSTMSTEQGERGARSAKEAFSVEEYEQAEFDAIGLAETVREQLCRPIVRFNLGPDFPLPKVTIQLDDLEDLNDRSEVDERVQGMGFPLTIGYISDKYGLPIPDGFEREDLLETAAGATEAALDAADRAGLLALAAEKKTALNWAISRSRSRGE